MELDFVAVYCSGMKCVSVEKEFLTFDKDDATLYGLDVGSEYFRSI